MPDSQLQKFARTSWALTVSLRDNFGDVTNLHDLLYRNVYEVTKLETEGAIVDVEANIMEMPWPTEIQECPILPLDEFAGEKGIGPVAFLKIDTEGMELEVLDGARELLRRTPRAAMETHSEEKHRGSIERLSAAGLRIAAERFGPRTGMVFASR